MNGANNMSEKKMIDTGFQRKLTRGQKSGDEPLNSPWEMQDRTQVVQQNHYDYYEYENPAFNSIRKSNVVL